MHRPKSIRWLIPPKSANSSQATPAVKNDLANEAEPAEPQIPLPCHPARERVEDRKVKTLDRIRGREIAPRMPANRRAAPRQSRVSSSGSMALPAAAANSHSLSDRSCGVVRLPEICNLQFSICNPGERAFWNGSRT
jgi:hypothetical protein